MRGATASRAYLLRGYVTRATGSPLDLHVSELIVEIRQDPEHNENALKQWRYRHVSRIHAGALGEWRLPDFLMALGKVIPHRRYRPGLESPSRRQA